MVEKESVNVNWQTLFAIIPIINFWSAYRIGKLRLYLLVAVAMVVIEFLIAVTVLDQEDFDCYYGIIECDLETDEPVIYLSLIIYAAISVILIRKWSKEWNAKITSENS